jgi:hypothetical protein
MTPTGCASLRDADRSLLDGRAQPTDSRLRGKQSMIHELRIYEAAPGKLGDLHRRFTDVTLAIWARLGIRPIGFWTTLVGPSSNALYYLLEWSDLAERDDKWGRFASDPEWIARKTESERNGVLTTKIENMLLAPTSYFTMPAG